MSRRIHGQTRRTISPGGGSSRSVHLPRFLVSSLLAILVSLNSVMVTHAGQVNVRIIKQEVVQQAIHWQLLQWQDNALICDVIAPGEKQPGAVEIISACGAKVFQDWLTTPACPQAMNGYGSACQGLFLRSAGETSLTVQKEVQLPKMSFKIQAAQCTPGNWCTSPPRLKITAIEPVVGQKIDKLSIVIGGVGEIFTSDKVELGLPLTDERGRWLEYWADSSLGDQSEHIRLKYRNFQAAADVPSYHFDLLGAEWFVSPPASASLIWNIFPPITRELPITLQQPQSSKDLHTAEKFLYLAGHLIQTGVVNANSCENWGLSTNGAANPCGQEAADQPVRDWQNKYNEAILMAALKYNVPARVIKGIIAQETQFWPLPDNPYELGLGRITDNGADLLLTWNLDYFLQTCVLVYGQTTCSAGYSSLSPVSRSMLRWPILNQKKADQQIDLLAATLSASAAQTNQMLINTLPVEADNAVTYEDMWKITIANYHSGSGCISVGMQALARQGMPLTFEYLVSQMVGGCQSAQEYVDKVFSLFDR